MGSWAISKKTPVRPIKAKREADLLRRSKLESRRVGKDSHESQRERQERIAGKARREYPLDLFKRSGGRPPRWRKNTIIDIPKRFSFISDPDEALECVYTIAEYLRDDRLNRIFFNHEGCETLDLCASAVMDILYIRGKKGGRGRIILQK
jgi:hypothetical protein